VTGKDIVLELLRRWGAKQSQGMSVELVDATGSCRSPTATPSRT
jgi:homoaconitase/3-isopropylmalate dehydratase large subunit